MKSLNKLYSLLFTLFPTAVVPFKLQANHAHRLGIMLLPENEYTPLDLSYRKSVYDNRKVERALNTDSEVVIGGKFHIIATASSSVGSLIETSQVLNKATTIRLECTKEGWGDGRHPTTNLCLGKYCYKISSHFFPNILTYLSLSLVVSLYPLP